MCRNRLPSEPSFPSPPLPWMVRVSAVADPTVDPGDESSLRRSTPSSPAPSEPAPRPHVIFRVLGVLGILLLFLFQFARLLCAQLCEWAEKLVIKARPLIRMITFIYQKPDKAKAIFVASYNLAWVTYDSGLWTWHDLFDILFGHPMRKMNEHHKSHDQNTSHSPTTVAEASRLKALHDKKRGLKVRLSRERGSREHVGGSREAATPSNASTKRTSKESSAKTTKLSKDTSAKRTPKESSKLATSVLTERSTQAATATVTPAKSTASSKPADDSSKKRSKSSK